MYFTYRIKWTKTGMSYYGVRYKDNITTESLMKTYFTSSKYVKEYIKIYGIPDIIQIRKTFDCKLAAKQWEERVISRGKLYNTHNWLNKGNNNSFKDVIMNDEMKKIISEKIKQRLCENKKLGKRRVYNDGKINKYFYETEDIPTEWKIGKLISDRQKEHIEKLNDMNRNMTEEQKRIKSEKLSKSTKGVPKPEGFGEKVSKSQRGISKPYQMGDNNPSKSELVRKKISDAWKNREIGIWLYDDRVKEKYYVKHSEHNIQQLIDQGYKRGRPLEYKRGNI